MKVVATAGHVDHGKSTLITALTGIDPDRLLEEKTREMTIDLGFSWLDLMSGETVGIIDVPGHRDFIENMLAGVGGIDAVIFVIAADEGIMPQTREHLAILDLLAVKSGIIVLTKVDRIDDPEWLVLVENDIRMEVKNTFLENSPIIQVSAKKNTGLATLLEELEKVLTQIPTPLDLGRPRVSVDRVFSMTGFGTIVTGTLINGHLITGSEITILPYEKKGRIRGLQSYKKKTDQILPGSRAAINIAGLDVKDIKRGDTITSSEFYKPSRLFDAFVRILPITKKIIKHNSEIKIFHLAAERNGRIRLLGKDAINPGEEGFVQIELNEPLVVVKDDRFIIRIPSPGETVGGGIVIQAESDRKYKRSSPELIKKLAILQRGTYEELILEDAQHDLICSAKKIATDLNLSTDDVYLALVRLVSSEKIIELSIVDASQKQKAFITITNWEKLILRTKKLLLDFHNKFPLRIGMSKEELRSKLQLESKQFNIILTELLKSNNFIENNNHIHLSSHKVSYSSDQNERIKKIITEIEKSPYAPPSYKEIETLLGEEILNSLIENQEFVRISNEVIFRKKEYDLMKNYVFTKINQDGTITVSEFRDYFKTSRKFALAMLENLDSAGFTIREGDFRKLRNVSK
jgi:selenocysteine-specific elongation factor